MADYQRVSQRFVFAGVSLLPADLLALAPGKYPYAQNVRSYQDGTLQPRGGLIAVTSGALAGGAIHSIYRLNDPTSFAPAPAMRYLGAGVALYARAPGAGAYPQIDTGYSGDPLSFVVASPIRSPQPWAYIGDSARLRKVNTANTVVPIGIAQPSAPSTAPAITLGAPGATVISDLDVAADWTAVGAVAAAPTNVTPVNTTISTIVYDAGATGYASIAPAAMTNVHVGQRLALAGAETVLVTDVLPAVATTTIGAIIYDAGATGACTIQPAASLGTGQLEAPRFDEYRRRFLTVAQEMVDPIAPQPAARVRQIDFPVNCLVTINSGGGSAETVRITSVAVGRDGVQSFRCVTANAHAAGESLTGVACFRAFTTGTRAAGNTVVGNAIQQVITPLTVEPVVGGIQDTTLAVDCALVGGRATQPEDEILLSVKVDILSAVDEIRLYLDVDAASTDFLQNYYQATWRANDIIAAIHATNTGVPTAVQDARQNAVLQNQVDQVPVDWQTGVQDFSGGIGSGLTDAMTPPAPPLPVPTASGAPTALSASSQQLALGNNQWLTLKIKVRDLIHVGTDLSRTLRNVGGAEVLLTLSGTAAAITVQYDSLLVQGGYGPDVGDTGQPIVYGYRYRSSTTGAFSNMSPPSRGGVVPRRQRVTGTATASADAQADLVDWFRYGGQLSRWTYVMTGAALVDDFLDQAVEGGVPPEACYQPWPTSDLPRSGTCNVAGTAVSRVAGDNFNTSWAPGTTITVNGVTTTLYASPASASLLHLVANVGSGAAVAWSIREPLLLSQPLPAHWGGAVDGVVFLFACGDPTDPGALHWSIGNNPDGTRESHWLAVTNASEPLQHGCVYDGAPFVFSTEGLYRIVPTFDAVNTFRVEGTACGKGLWSRWAFAVAPEGIYFLGKDGIYLTAWGGAAVSITDPDLTAIFPHDGAPGVTVGDVTPPRMSQPTRLRLAVVDEYLYFDYRDEFNVDRTLVYHRGTKAWSQDLYAVAGARVRLAEPGAQVEDHIIGAQDGHAYQMLQTAFADIATAIAWRVDTPWPDLGDPRVVKLWGDVVLDYDQRGATTAISVVPVYDDATSTLPAQTFGAGTSGRRQQVIDVVDADGDGVLGRNFGLRISGTSVAADANRPILYLWEPAYVPKVEQTEGRATDWDAGGYQGTKLVRGVVIEADTYGVAKTVEIQREGGVVAATITITTSGQQRVPFALDPFHARLLRLVPTDETPWLLFADKTDWIADPKPELVSLATDWTDDGYVGTKFMQGVVLHVDTGGEAGVEVQVQHDNGAVGATLTLAATTGEDGQPFSFPEPFLAHVLRIVPLDPVRLIKWRYVWEPAPELALVYETQPTTHDFPGYFSDRDMLVAHESTADVRLTVTYDDGPTDVYLLRHGSGTYRRDYVVLEASKGRAVTYRWESDAPFRLYQRDMSVRSQAWGAGGGYMITTPFGGPSRVAGALI